MKKLLFISLNDNVPWGGSEELWSKTARKLSGELQISILVKRWDPEPLPIYEMRNFKIKIYYKKKEYLRRGILRRIIRSIKKNKDEYNELDSVQNIHENDLVIISLGDHSDYKLIKYATFLRQKNIPYVILVQLSTDLRIINDYDLTQLTKNYQLAKKVYFVSEENLLKTEMQFGVKLFNTELIDNPFNYNQKYIRIKPGNKIIKLACVASFTSFHKGQDLLISVLGQKKWKNRDFQLNLYGKGINKEQIFRLIEINDLKEKVILNGFEENITKIWEDNHALIMTSRMEGQSLAMLEAMVHGRMVISTKVGDAGRLIKDGITGYLIPAPTFELIDNALEIAWKERNKWMKMGVSSREHLFNIIDIDPVTKFSEKLKFLLNSKN